LPEPFSTEQLNQLRQRWERDPKSRAFLQLAEEYRRAGRLADAILVLRAGLREHPGYLAAQVALGRCLVETGDSVAAIEILERAVARDPTQLVANKLLVEAYIATGQASRARERLDLYRLFNDRDAEIELLASRIVALERLSPEPSAATRATTGATLSDPGEALFALPAIAALPAVNLEPIVPPPARSVDREGEPFGVLALPGATRRIDEAFFEQGIFVLAPAEPAPVEPVVAAPLDWESASWPTGSAQLDSIDSMAPATALAPLAAVPALSEPEALPAAPEPIAEPVFEAAPELVLEPEPAPMPAMPPIAPIDLASPPETPQTASSTLGELYLSQGHLDEAEESFLSVLEARPGDSAALAGLESVRQQRGDESGAFAEEVANTEESNVIVGGLTARKAALLRDFLARIRRGAERHVS
jgi:tetratricopeptide (TPR) repeat protein